MTAAVRRSALALALLAPLAPGLRAENAPEVRPPQPVVRQAPEYPVELRRRHVSGSADIVCVVDENGRVAEATVATATHFEFGLAAQLAAKRWQFDPGTRNGAPARFRVQIPFVFNEGFETEIEQTFGRKIYVELDHPAVPAESLPVYPQPIQRAWPRYPRHLVGTGAKGGAMVSFVIDHEGRAINPEVLKTDHEGFVTPAIASVLSLVYEPVPDAAGRPQYVSVCVQFLFDEKQMKEEEKAQQKRIVLPARRRPAGPPASSAAEAAPARP